MRILNFYFDSVQLNDVEKDFFFWLHSAACGIFSSLKPMPRAGEVLSLNHWTAREVPKKTSFEKDTSILPWLECEKQKGLRWNES